MEGHFHLGVEHLALGAIGIAVMFHIFRILAGLIAKGPGVVKTVGTSIGGFFTFGGAS